MVGVNLFVTMMYSFLDVTAYSVTGGTWFTGQRLHCTAKSLCDSFLISFL